MCGQLWPVHRLQALLYVSVSSSQILGPSLTRIPQIQSQSSQFRLATPDPRTPPLRLSQPASPITIADSSPPTTPPHPDMYSGGDGGAPSPLSLSSPVVTQSFSAHDTQLASQPFTPGFGIFTQATHPPEQGASQSQGVGSQGMSSSFANTVHRSRC